MSITKQLIWITIESQNPLTSIVIWRRRQKKPHRFKTIWGRV